ncbi:hypothetical protein [Acidovorax sp.]|uniref:hypothetical protein n=1 Tax=Acidovorax sp. TaxID=1872122 RepID=UPI003CFF1B3E
MIAGLYTYVATALVAGALASAGAWRVQEWRWTSKTTTEQLQRQEAASLAEAARQSDALQQRKFSDTAAGAHARTVATLNQQLGDARAHAATLSPHRQCLDAGTVRLLNATGRVPGGVGLRASASHLAGAATAPAGPGADAGAGDAFASERDTAAHIATCRAGYAALADQVNQILDIEDQRQAGK